MLGSEDSALCSKYPNAAVALRRTRNSMSGVQVACIICCYNIVHRSPPQLQASHIPIRRPPCLLLSCYLITMHVSYCVAIFNANKRNGHSGQHCLSSGGVCLQSAVPWATLCQFLGLSFIARWRVWLEILAWNTKQLFYDSRLHDSREMKQIICFRALLKP